MKILTKAVAVLFLASLWVYQLPVSPVERVLMKIFRPIQKVAFTDRQYRMYAPDPRSAKRIPFLEIRTDLSPVRFLKDPPGRSLGLLTMLSREKWKNFLDELAKALAGEKFFFSKEEGEEFFRRLAERICRDEADLGDRVRIVTLESRRVAYGKFRGDIVLDPPEILEEHPCP